MVESCFELVSVFNKLVGFEMKSGIEDGQK